MSSNSNQLQVKVIKPIGPFQVGDVLTETTDSKRFEGEHGSVMTTLVFKAMSPAGYVELL